MEKAAEMECDLGGRTWGSGGKEAVGSAFKVEETEIREQGAETSNAPLVDVDGISRGEQAFVGAQQGGRRDEAMEWARA